MTVIDTNVILRYLLNDIQEQADKASKIIDGGSSSTTANKLFFCDERDMHCDFVLHDNTRSFAY